MRIGTCILLGAFLFMANKGEIPQIKSLPSQMGLEILQEAYPEEIKEVVFDYKHNDWVAVMSTHEGKDVRLFWAEGRMITEEQLLESHKYRCQFYTYPHEIKDPATMDEHYIRILNSYTGKQVRKNGAISSPAFFDTIYDASSQESIEKHLVKTTFLGKKTTVHKKILEPLKRVEKTIYRSRLLNWEMREFIKTLSTCDCYHWREIRDSSSRSFHSYAVAIDILPKGWGNKIMYWSWERSRNPDWMLVPIQKRWNPPQIVIDAFEAEGFIWGGKWDIWDNMHFEYRPELFHFREKLEESLIEPSYSSES